MIEIVNSRVLTVDFVGRLVDEVNDWLSDTRVLEANLEAAQKKVKKLEKAIKSLLDLLEMHPSVDLLNRLKQREQEREVERNKIKRLQPR